MSQKSDTKARIIRAAVRILGTEGAAGVTNRRIAAEAGVSLGSITYHFESQREIVRAAIAAFVADEVENFSALAERAAASGGDLAEAGQVVGELVAESGFGGDHIAWFELFIQAARHRELHTATTEFFDTYDRVAASVLTAFGVEEPEEVAPMAVAMLIGLQLRKLATGGSGDDVVAALTRLVEATSAPR